MREERDTLGLSDGLCRSHFSPDRFNNLVVVWDDHGDQFAKRISFLRGLGAEIRHLKHGLLCFAGGPISHSEGNSLLVSSKPTALEKGCGLPGPSTFQGLP